MVATCTCSGCLASGVLIFRFVWTMGAGGATKVVNAVNPLEFPIHT